MCNLWHIIGLILLPMTNSNNYFKNCLKLSGFFSFFLFLSITSVNAQKVSINDSNYFEVFPKTLVLRLYGIHKYSQFTIPSENIAPDLKYTPNTKYSIGAGFTYKNFTLTGALGFGFLNRDDDKGKTKSFNLQINAFPTNYSVTLFATFHNGEHLEPRGTGSLSANSYYYRPDIKSNFVGLSAYRIANASRFSYRAAITQNEWQKKSAGSLLYGGQAFYSSIKGDSNLVPSVSTGLYKQEGIDKITNISVGPGIGYAYTLVAAQHFYIMASFIGSATLNFSKEYEAGVNNSKVSVLPAGLYRAAIGYNSASWGVAGIWAGAAILFKGNASAKSYFMPTGLFSVAVTKKIYLKK